MNPNDSDSKTPDCEYAELPSDMLPAGQQPPKREAPQTFHVPIEPTGMNAQGTVHFSQGLLPNSCWLVVPASAVSHPEVPVPQVQVMNSVDYMKVVEIACADLSMTTKMKYQKPKPSDFMSQMKEQFERGHYNRALAMLNNASGGAAGPSTTQSTSPPGGPGASQ